jgi:hypothetical protein
VTVNPGASFQSMMNAVRLAYGKYGYGVAKTHPVVQFSMVQGDCAGPVLKNANRPVLRHLLVVAPRVLNPSPNNRSHPMPAPFPPNDTAVVRFRYTREQPAPAPQPPPAGSPPGTPAIIRPAIAAGTEDVEVFELDPPARDIAEVERQWREANPPKSDKEWQDARFPDPAANPPPPAPLKEEPDVDAQGVRHRAAGEEEDRPTVTKTEDARPEPTGKGKGKSTAATTTGTDDDSPVSDTNADEAIEQVGRMRSKDRLQHVIDNDKRSTVQDAARKRLEALNA